MTVWRRALWWVPALVLVAALCGCAAVVSTLGALNADGFASPSVNVDADPGGTTVAVGAAGHRTLPDEAAVDRAAELVWRTTEVRLDRVEATVGGRHAEYDRCGP